jgi:tetratricopeptide (TPR) repeat protein
MPAAMERISSFFFAAAAIFFAQASLAALEKERALALLEARNYAELDRQLMSEQQGYTQGTVGELDLLQAFRAFYTTDPALHLRFNEWVQLYPRSYASRLARGIYYKRIGMEYRGVNYASGTAAWRFAQMEAYFRKSMNDLEASVDLAPKPILSYLYMMDIQKYSGPWSITIWLFRFNLLDLNEYTLKKALDIAPNSFIIRRKYMHTLEARWGGSRGAMEAFFAQCRKANVKRDELDMLQALVHADRGWVRYASRDFAGAFDEYQRAGSLVDLKSDRLFEYGMRAAFIHGIAQGYHGVKRHEEALPLFNEAIEAGANYADVYLSRGISLHYLGRKKESLEDYLRAAERGNAWAQNEVGKHYWHGGLVERNREEAIKWFNRAADQGLADARKNLEWANKL